MLPRGVDSGEVRRSDDAGVVDEFRDCKRGLGVEPARGQVRKKGFANGVEEHVAGDRDSPAEYEDLRVEHGGKARARSAQPAAELAQRLERSG